MEKYSEKRRFGNLGEDIAEMFLVKNGFHVKKRNYLKKWGELDIVSEKDRIIHFIEVKTISDRRFSHETNTLNVSREVSRNCFTKYDFHIIISRESDDGAYLPEDNVNFWKQKRMVRAIQTYLIDHDVNENIEWQIDVITVKLDLIRKTAIIKHIENVVFDI